MINVLKEYPVRLFIPLKTWNNIGEHTSVSAKHEAAKRWIEDTLHYPRDHYGRSCGVMDYICIRFKNNEDAAYFKLVWA